MRIFNFHGWVLRLAFVLGAASLSACVFAPGQHHPREALEGTWVASVSAAPGQPSPFLSVVTYIPTGQSLEENNTPMIRSLGHGEWKRTGRRKFQRTMTFFSFTGTRTYSGVVRVVSDITLEPGGDSYNEVSRFEIYDPAGQLLFSGQNTGRANRCGIGRSVSMNLEHLVESARV